MRDLDCIGPNLHWLALGAAVALVGLLAFAPHAHAAEPPLKDIEKHKFFPKPLIVLKKDNLKDILDYVINKYGIDYIKLYEGNPYNNLTNICKVCGKSCKSKNIYCSRICAGKGNNRNSKYK